MRTSLNEIALVESHLLKTAAPGDALLMEAKAILDPSFRQNIIAQKESYGVIKLYGRKQLKAELENIHHKLFTETRHHLFAAAIRKLFGKV